MNPEVDVVLAQIAVVEREMLVVSSGSPIMAYDQTPYSISNANMPLFINFAGGLTGNVLMGSDDKGREFQETRIYSLVLYYAPYAAGIEGEKLAAMVPYFQKTYDLFGSYPHLKQLGGIVSALITSDSGQSVQRFVNQDYFGVRFSLQVVSRVRRLLAAGE
jgi:hypothetical protein